MIYAKMKVKKIALSAILPTKHHADDAGWDLYSVEDGLIPPGQTNAIRTGLSVEIPQGWYGQVKTRSSYGVRGLIVTAGVIDSPYRGEIKVVLINTGNVESRYKAGDKIAQLLLLPVPEVEWEEVTELNNTKRGANGFGSSGR